MLWQDLERYVLEQSAARQQFKVQVITGPIFGLARIRSFAESPYPFGFWKVVVAVTSQNGKLFATAYILGQKETIAKYRYRRRRSRRRLALSRTYQRPVSLDRKFRQA